MRTRCWDTSDDLAHALAQTLAQDAARIESGPHAIMLSGGTTPLAAYALLTEHPPVVGPGLHVLFSDERHVPANSPHSNCGQIQPMLQAWGLPPNRILNVHGDDPLNQATEAYDQAIERFLGTGGIIHLGLLGLGADGHTASLFNAQQIVQSQATWAVAVQRPDGMNGISVTPRLLQRVKRIIFVVTGAGKRAMVSTLLRQPHTIPAGLAVSGHPNVEVWTDQAARPAE
jgi:6-phosphogluconolactonase